MLKIQPLLADVLAMGRAGWSRAHREREEQKLAEDEPWRLGITDEMGIAHMPSDGETQRIHLGCMLHGSAGFSDIFGSLM
jgi:ABC-type hemin transport system ATPase subunit